MSAPRILVFDSGLGGLTVLAAVHRALPGAALRYVADDAGFPYGDMDEDGLIERCRAVLADLIPTFRPDAVVIACNTASTLALPALRARFSLPFVGTVPAIKPAAEMTRTGMVSVLATPGTVARDYTRDLIRAYAGHVHVRLVGTAHLAELAEAVVSGRAVADAAIRAEIEPAFAKNEEAATDTIVLGCTHFPLILDRLNELASWPVEWIDPAPAIARRLATVLDDIQPSAAGAGAAFAAPTRTGLDFLFTSGRTLDPVLRGVLRRLKLSHLTA